MSEYSMFRLAGRDVAGFGASRSAAPAWMTYIQVDDADRAAAKVTEAGGSLVREPFDSLEGGRMAIVADPAGRRVRGLAARGAQRRRSSSTSRARGR